MSGGRVPDEKLVNSQTSEIPGQASDHHISQWPFERGAELPRRAGRMASRWERLALRFEHGLYRQRNSRPPRLCSILVLLLDPAAYELAPLLLSDKALNLRRRIARRLVVLLSGRPACSSLASKIILEISEADEKRLVQKFQDSLYS